MRVLKGISSTYLPKPLFRQDVSLLDLGKTILLQFSLIRTYLIKLTTKRNMSNILYLFTTVIKNHCVPEL